MELHELIGAVKAAMTKEDLADLVQKELGIGIDKRKNLDTLRAEVLVGLAGAINDADEGATDAAAVSVLQPGQEGAQPAASPEAGPAVEGIVALAVPETDKVMPAAVAMLDGPAMADSTPAISTLAEEPGLTLPELEPELVSEPAKPKQRMLQHKKTGRLLVWTPELDAMPELEEV